MKRRTSFICLLFLVHAMGLSSSLKPVGGGNSRRNRGRRDNRGSGGDGDGDDGGSSRNSIPLIQVSCRDEWYPMEHCVTVGDILTELKRKHRSDKIENNRAKVIVRGKVLEDPKSILSEQGVRNGDTVLVVVGNQPLQPHEALAMFLEMIAGDNGGVPLAKLMEQWRKQGLGAYLPHLLPDMEAFQISQSLRNAVDLGYHRLRSWWEQPDFRRRLLQPELEVYRKVLKRHLPTTIQKELSPAAQQILQNPEAWQQQIGKVGQTLLQYGDVILDGLLDIVLDIVQGAGRNRQDSLSGQFGKTSGASPPSSAASYEPTMEDPFMANQMLYELSESEDD